MFRTKNNVLDDELVLKLIPLKIFLLVFSLPAYAAEIPDFALLDHAGNFHKLSDYQSYDGVVIVTQSQNESLSKDAVIELNAIRKRFDEMSLAFFFLNTDPAESRDEIALSAKALPTELLVLHDPSQTVAKTLGAVKTNTAYLIEPASLRLVYSGPISKKFVTGKVSTDRYLSEALPLLTTSNEAIVNSDAIAGLDIQYAENKQYSYRDDIAPLLKKNCAYCHRDGGIGPWSMNSYKMIRGWAPMIRETVMTLRMPPGHIDDQYQHFNGLPQLPTADKRALISWIDAGAPRGEGDDPLENLTWNEKKWVLGKPDKIIKIPKQDIPATGVLDYRYVTVDMQLDQDVWVKAMEIQPGNPTVTHHITSSITMPGGNDKKPGENIYLRRRLVSYVPGRQPTIFSEGTGKFIPKGSKVNIQLHYTTTGKATSDESEIALYYLDKAPTYEVFSDAAVNWTFNIPPQTATYDVSAKAEILADSIVHSLIPHMHFRGKKIKYTALLPDGSQKILLSVPNYNFNWQFQYDFSEPIFLPAGTVVEVTGSFDNSSLNPFNPDPDRWVSYGDQSWDEMFFGFFMYHYANLETYKYPSSDQPIELSQNRDLVRGVWNWRTGPLKVAFNEVDQNGTVNGFFDRLISHRNIAFDGTDEGWAEIKNNKLYIGHILRGQKILYELQLYKTNTGKFYLFGTRSTGGGDRYNVTFFKETE